MRTRTAAELCELELEASLLCEVLAREPVPLGEAGGGVGAYLLFYTGRNELYRGISPSLRPIYVGSADSVTTRIRQHMDSILHVGGLEVDDFAAVVISTKGKGLAAMAEQTFVRAFEPAWNATRFRGFGCKDQGRTRAKNQIPSSWDKLHPGRPWALTSRRDTELEADIREYVRAPGADSALGPVLLGEAAHCNAGGLGRDQRRLPILRYSLGPRSCDSGVPPRVRLATCDSEAVDDVDVE